MKPGLNSLHSPCPDCGAPAAGDREGCQALWDAIAAKAFADLQYASVRDLAFDAYCMQHLERYCRSAKSYAAHLTRLCCGLEYAGDPQVYAAIQKWLNGAPPVSGPQDLPFLGKITVADVAAVKTGDAFRKQAREWAESVWEAFTPQQALARSWVRLALDRA